MLNFYESFICGQATCQAMDDLGPAIESIEKTAIKLVAPVGLSVIISACPVAAQIGQGIKRLFKKQTSFPESFKPSYTPELWKVISTTTGGGLQLHTYCSSVERSIQKIKMPSVQEVESRLPGHPAPAFIPSSQIAGV